MADLNRQNILHLYEILSSPISTFDCGEKCSVYNQNHIPFCCDIHHSIPIAYGAEWDYLIRNTDLWHLFPEKNNRDVMHLKDKIAEDQVLIECQGHLKCQRNYRSITCRCFPFFPYIDHRGIFIGLTYYWEYEDRCWVINHLDTVTPQFRDEFINAFDYVFQNSKQEFANFRHQSVIMRRVFGRNHRAIPLISRKSTVQLQLYKVTPKNGRMRKAVAYSFRKHGVYYFAEKLPFAGEE